MRDGFTWRFAGPVHARWVDEYPFDDGTVGSFQALTGSDECTATQFLAPIICFKEFPQYFIRNLKIKANAHVRPPAGIIRRPIKLVVIVV